MQNQFHLHNCILMHDQLIYVLCGGDWLNSEYDTNNALAYCGRVPNLMQTEIGINCYTAIGNHDNNSDAYPNKKWNTKVMNRLWFGRDVGYYIVKNDSADCYIFDSHEMTHELIDYDYRQVEWFI